MIYIALLRGINVGGNNKIDMKLLKQAFEQAGMNNVKTYINSGNIIFTDNSHSKAELPRILEEAILASFGLQIKVVVRSFDDMQKVISSLPDSWTNDDRMKSDVMFLWEEVDNESVLDKLLIKPDIDTVIYVAGAILWSVDRKNAAKSGMQKLPGSKLYQNMTIRNVNTTRKVYELMQAQAAAE
ncbi:DUF1697 domain-containing protein [Paenibacillus sp. CECT 9249]|uniref:DUF1697 domain-containing protein n=1 Tax=unclassified Paenibacillus TaxID=185978 RepID=UPI001C113E29|nr:DUF1697 domain-containing protein [Paenibacillus sp. CECT 9249]MBU5440702.1 DUF1697 domain-containing protein [Paenibacillus sp. MSJ-34]CAH0120444.1 hypothetical protein PAE9249_02963 [Paenibacillus sp. CECT 9249]